MTDTWLALENKIVVVTGGASGIGKHVVEGLLRAGAKVAVFDVAVENGVQSSSGAHFFRVDITDPDSVERAVSSVVEELGEITTLVNNAGINLPRMLVDPKGAKSQYELDVAAFDRMFAVNVRGAFLVAQAVARRMVAAGSGTIVNVTSEAGSEGSKGQSAYSASKAAINGLTLSWAKELGPWEFASWALLPEFSSPRVSVVPRTTRPSRIPVAPRSTTCLPITPRSFRWVAPESSTRWPTWFATSQATAPATSPARR
jgi:sorbitol-6-phosphate 2-dehydrogenase